MASVKIHTQENKEAGTLELSSNVFDVEVRPEILNLVVRAIRASKRSGTHSTKTRAFVSGGGAKPWKQKGTGRARAGSSRSPLWRGGAVIFGPQNRDYSFKINKKVRSLALRMALSTRFQSGMLLVVDSITLPSVSTKNFAKVLGNFELNKVLIIGDTMDSTIALSSRNLAGVTYTTPDKINVYEILKHKHLLLLKGAVEQIHARFEG